LDLKGIEEYVALGFVPNVKNYVDEVKLDRFLGDVSHRKVKICMEILVGKPEGKRSPGGPTCKTVK
jgi:hypothetical protein